MSHVLSGVIFAVLAALFFWWWVSRLRRSWQDEAGWVRATEKAATKHGIVLRPDITVRLAKYLRRQNLIGQLVMLPLIFVLVSIDPFASAMDGHPQPGPLVAGLVALPWLVVVIGLVMGFPTWNKTRQQRVAHLGVNRLRDAFTVGEWRMLGAGAVAGLAAASWSLSRGDVSSQWWLIWFASLAVYVLTWRWAAGVVMRHPSHASDDLELAWDDVVRHGQMRALTLGAVWTPTGVAMIVASGMLFDPGNFLRMYAFAGVAFLLYRFFKRGDQLWRRAWETA